MDALQFGYRQPSDDEEAFSPFCASPYQLLILNRRTAGYDENSVVRPINYMIQFVQGSINDCKIVFAYSSAVLKKDDKSPEPYSVTMEGELRKCGDSHQTWHNRHFVLKCCKLSYYKSESSLKLIKSIKLQNTEIIRKDETNFTLKTSQCDRLWRFAAKDRATCEQWIRSIKQATIYSQ